MNNPFKPGAWHMPPFLSGRHTEMKDFIELTHQSTILKNIIVTGLRWVGKTVFLEEMRKQIISTNRWRWVQNDISESSSISEENLATRMIADLSVVTNDIVVYQEEIQKIGFQIWEHTEVTEMRLNYDFLTYIYHSAPWLASDKMKHLLEYVWQLLRENKKDIGIIFAYDEAQNLDDHAKSEQYPLSLLLEVFQSLQRKWAPFLLVLTGLPTIFPKLVWARTYSERMFHTITLDHLSIEESKQAIVRPLQGLESGYIFSEVIQDEIVRISWGYPYFIQFISKEVFDFYLSTHTEIDVNFLSQILHKLDEDFFMGRWSNTTDREQELLKVIAWIISDDAEFSIQDILSTERIQMSSSQINQTLMRLINKGFLYKNRHGKYIFAVPLLGSFIKRNFKNQT